MRESRSARGESGGELGTARPPSTGGGEGSAFSISVCAVVRSQIASLPASNCTCGRRGANAAMSW
jgi:hypothetical protein